jgi:signal transduction histidine kinase
LFAGIALDGSAITIEDSGNRKAYGRDISAEQILLRGGAAVGLQLDVRALAGLQADTDPIRLRQIVANLLSNAVKYAPEGQVTVETEIRQFGDPRPGPWVTLSVTDTGPGIPADKRELIFHTRLDPEAQHGASIGLAISRRIARLLGGDLTVESEVARGSTFTLWLPAPTVNLSRAS